MDVNTEYYKICNAAVLTVVLTARLLHKMQKVS